VAICRFADLQFADHIFLQLSDTIIFRRLNTSAYPQIKNFPPYEFQPKMLSFKLKDDFWLFGQLHGISQTGTPRKFAGLQFADYSLQICGFTICGLANLRNLRICDCGMNPRICGFAFADLQKNVCAHLLWFVISQFFYY
jgi:hypothetical protein